MKKKVYILFCLLYFFPLGKLFADGIEFSASAPNVVAVGEQFRLRFSVNGEGTDFKAPTFTNFTILAGPSTSSSSSVQIVNGQMTSSYSYTYTYILKSKKEGKFKIKPAKITVNNKVYTSNHLSIEVVKAKKPASSNNRNQNTNTSNNIKVGKKDLFVRVDLSKTKVTKGEHIVATMKVYTNKNLAGFNDIKFPSFSGFWTQEIPTPDQISLQRENVGGKIYDVGTLKKMILYPQRDGEITIEPFELECILRIKTGKRSFWGASFKEVKKKVQSSARVVKVKELPTNAPLSFNGAVGEFRMNTSIDKKNLKANDAINLKIKISGNGNLNLIDKLNINFPADFEVFDPKVSNNQKASSQGLKGSKIFEYLLIPRHAGDFEISPIEFTYFSVKQKKFKTLKSKNFKIHVERGEGDTANVVYNQISKEEIRILGQDIRYIKTNEFSLNPKDKLFLGSLNFYLSFIIPFILFFTFFVIRRKQIKENSNILLVKHRKANRVSQKRLKQAQIYLQENNINLFYDEILKTIWGYLSDKLSIPVAELSKEKAVEYLENQEINKSIIEKLIALVETCEIAHFSPVEDHDKMENIYQEISEIINQLEGNLK